MSVVLGRSALKEMYCVLLAESMRDVRSMTGFPELCSIAPADFTWQNLRMAEFRRFVI